MKTIETTCFFTGHRDIPDGQYDAIFESVEYAAIKESDEFKALVTNADKYTVDELKVKADLLFAASMKKKFSVETENLEKHSVGTNFNAKPNEKSQAYAGLFDD